MGIWAKSDGKSLREHTLDVIKSAEKLWEKVRDEINTNPLNEKEFRKLLIISAFAHDLGKVWPPFQKSVHNKEFPIKDEKLPQIQHNLLSVFFLDKERALNYITEDEDKWGTIAPLLYSAIAFHHWRLTSKSLLFGSNPTLKKAAESLLENNLGEVLTEHLKNEFDSIALEEIGYLKEHVSFDKGLAKFVAGGGSFLQSGIFFPPYTIEFLPQRMKETLGGGKIESLLWVFLAGFLMRADHFASWMEKEREKENLSIAIEISPLKNVVLPKLAEKISLKNWKNLWQAKKVDNVKDKNTILIAPTGIGKTEFAFAWAEGHKFIFTLPLRVATNQIFERARKIFGDSAADSREYVGLLHSDADVYLSETQNSEGEAFPVHDLAKHLSFPAIIATGDQFFPSALRYPGYEKIYATLGYSRLIIDEVQAYDPQATAIVVKLIKDISALGGKFLLMTATLPVFVKEKLGEVDKETDLYKNGGFKFPIKHKIEVIRGDIKGHAEKIIEKAQNGRRVLVVLNTVEEAQDVYKSLKEKAGDIDILLLHSRFTYLDRWKIEMCVAEEKLPKRAPHKLKKEQEKGTIIVATQIVEASLDIDADYLYTEVAPADSLVQRMGRVLRGIRPSQNGNVWDGYGDIYGNEANIKIFVNTGDDKSYESGKGRVYKNYLIEATLYLLSKLDQAGKDYLSNMDGKKLKKEVKNLLNPRNKMVARFLTEPDKKKWVEEVYHSEFLRRIGYLEKFENTLAVLEAGYVSERRDEAQRLFRDIRSVNVIPEGKLEEAKEELKNLAKNKISYTEFKKNFINKFVVPVNEGTIRWKYQTNLQELNWYLSEEISEKFRRYLQGIYVVKLDYDENEGLKPPGKS